MEAGLDSLGAVELRSALGAKFGIEMPATLTFDHPSITALAAHVSANLSTAAGPVPLSPAAHAHAVSMTIDTLVAETLGPVRADQVLEPLCIVTLVVWACKGLLHNEHPGRYVA